MGRLWKMAQKETIPNNEYWWYHFMAILLYFLMNYIAFSSFTLRFNITRRYLHFSLSSFKLASSNWLINHNVWFFISSSVWFMGFWKCSITTSSRINFCFRTFAIKAASFSKYLMSYGWLKGILNLLLLRIWYLVTRKKDFIKCSWYLSRKSSGIFLEIRVIQPSIYPWYLTKVSSDNLWSFALLKNS